MHGTTNRALCPSGMSLTLLLVLTGANPALAAEFGKLHLDLCEKLVRNTERTRIAPIARPPHMRLFKEPAFGTLTRRISDSAPGQVNKPAGNPAQAWNIDESLMLVHRYLNGDTHEIVLLDGKSYQEVRVLDMPDVRSENLFWSHTDPSILYFVAERGSDAGKLMQLNVNTAQRLVLTDFAPLCETAGFSADAGLLAKPSYDNNSFGYQCSVSAEKSLAVAYHADIDSSYTLRLGKGTAFIYGAAPTPSPDGKHYWLQGSVLDRQLASPKSIDMAEPLNAHTLAESANAGNVIYQAAVEPSPKGCGSDLWNGTGLLIEHSMDDASCNSLINQTDNYPDTPQGTDIFASAYRSPAWLAMSSVGYDDLDYFSNKRLAPLLFSEIYLVNTRRKHTEICRLAHHRSFGRVARNASYDPDLGEPNVTISPTATRVLFASDWYDSGLVDTYVLELPSFSRFELAGNWVDRDNPAILTSFVQRGEKITFERIIPTESADIVTSGSGEIEGSKLQLDYVVQASSNRRVTGKCTSTLSGVPESIQFECRDSYFGRLIAVLVRPG